MIIRRRFRCRSINTCLAIFFQIITCRRPSAQGFRICTSLIGFQRCFIPIRPFCITILSNSFLKSRITSFVIRFIFIIIRFLIRSFTTVLQLIGIHQCLCRAVSTSTVLQSDRKIIFLKRIGSTYGTTTENEFIDCNTITFCIP